MIERKKIQQYHFIYGSTISAFERKMYFSLSFAFSIQMQRIFHLSCSCLFSHHLGQMAESKAPFAAIVWSNVSRQTSKESRDVSLSMSDKDSALVYE
jgi:hypothetical protein